MTSVVALPPPAYARACTALGCACGDILLVSTASAPHLRHPAELQLLPAGMAAASAATSATSTAAATRIPELGRGTSARFVWADVDVAAADPSPVETAETKTPAPAGTPSAAATTRTTHASRARCAVSAHLHATFSAAAEASAAAGPSHPTARTTTTPALQLRLSAVPAAVSPPPAAASVVLTLVPPSTHVRRERLDALRSRCPTLPKLAALYLHGIPVAVGSRIPVSWFGGGDDADDDDVLLVLSTTATTTAPAPVVTIDGATTTVTFAAPPAPPAPPMDAPEDVLRRVRASVRGLDAQCVRVARLWRAAAAPRPHPWHPHGVLLHGAPGTGKTLLAAALAEHLPPRRRVRQQGGRASQIVVGAAELFQRDFGAGERFLAQCFGAAAAEAEASGCALLVLDEIDLICSSADAGGSQAGARNRSLLKERLRALLFLLLDDAFERRLPLLVLGVTSRPDTLCRDLLRPGRLEVVLECPIPDTAGRLDMLRLMTAHMQPSPSPSASEADSAMARRLAAVARSSRGMVGADLASLCREAALHRVRVLGGGGDGGKEITMNDWQHALAVVKPSGLRSTAHDTHVPEGTLGVSELVGMARLGARAAAAVLAPLRQASRYWAMGIAPPSGLLLHGPSGNGKTALALALARDAQRDGLANFISVRCTELVSKVVGESEAAVAAVFRRARAMAPCIVLLDQIEAIAPVRGSSGAGSSEHTWDRLLSCLLTELDGIGSKQNAPGARRGAGAVDDNTAAANTDGAEGTEYKSISVIGATVDIRRLDRALIRPGRFDTHLLVDAPTAHEREALLRHGLRKAAPEMPQPDVEAAAFGLAGKSRAEVLGACREAIMHALREKVDDPVLTPAHLRRATLQAAGALSLSC